MLRSLNTLPLPGLAKIKLQENGFLYWEDIRNEKGFVKDGLKILQQWNLQNSCESLTEVPATRSALDVWQEECSTPKIVTFCKDLDAMLDGGITLGEVTEFNGAPGSGKTQLCLQLCVDVQIPESLGGVAGKAIFIDSGHGFSPARFKELATACVKHCHTVDVEKEAVTNFTIETVMNGIYCMTVNDHIELIAAVECVEEFLQSTPQVRLVVVDSITFPFCLWVTNSLQRTKLLCTLVDKLKIIANKYKVAVVVTNQLTTKIDSPECRRLVPSMGDSFGHLLNQRLMLGRLNNTCFAAMLVKSPTRSLQSTAKFQVVPAGIRSCADGT